MRIVDCAVLALLIALPGIPVDDRDNSGAQSRDAIVKAEFIFEQAPFTSCHASTIAETKGELVAAWFGGTRERNPDVGIWVSKRDKNGWSKLAEVANGVQPTGERFPCWNPVLFQPARGPLLLFY